MTATLAAAIDGDFDALLGARHHDPFGLLGLHRDGAAWVQRVFRPDASAVWLRTAAGFVPMQKVHPQGVFVWHGREAPPQPVLLQISEAGRTFALHDPYGFAPAIGADDLYLFNEGRLEQAYRVLGSHVGVRDGVAGVRFACWAPNASRVSVVSISSQVPSAPFFATIRLAIARGFCVG